MITKDSKICVYFNIYKMPCGEIYRPAEMCYDSREEADRCEDDCQGTRIACVKLEKSYLAEGRFDK